MIRDDERGPRPSGRTPCSWRGAGRQLTLVALLALTGLALGGCRGVLNPRPEDPGGEKTAPPTGVDDRGAGGAAGSATPPGTGGGGQFNAADAGIGIIPEGPRGDAGASVDLDAGTSDATGDAADASGPTS